MRKFEVGDKIKFGTSDGLVYEVAKVYENGDISLVGHQGIYHALAFKLIDDTPLLDEPNEIDLLHDRVDILESLCSDYVKIIEEKDAEIEKLKHQALRTASNTCVGIEREFKPISKMTLEDWKQALNEGWRFEIGTDFDTHSVLEIEYFKNRDLYPIRLTNNEWYTLEGRYLSDEYSQNDIIKRIK